MGSRVYTINDFRGTLKEIAKKFNVDYGTIKSRLSKGMSLEEATSSPVLRNRHIKRYTIKGITGTRKELCRYFGISYSTVTSKVGRGMSVEEAILDTLLNKK